MSFTPPTPPDELTDVQSLRCTSPYRLRGDCRIITPSTVSPKVTSTHYDPVIILLIGYLDQVKPKALDDAVKTAYSKSPEDMEKMNVRDAHSFLDFANKLLKWIPHEGCEGKDIYDIIWMTYFIFDQPPLLELQTPIHPNQADQPLTWLSSWLVTFAQLIGLFMDTPASMTHQSLETFKKSPRYSYDEAIEPARGFLTFNEFFCRRLKPNSRPIECPQDDCVIVYPADCTFDTSTPNNSIVNIDSQGVVMIKGLPWTIGMLLQGSDYAGDFEGGVWMHAFLSTYNYHRQHAPVSGTVLEVRNIQGSAYLMAKPKYHHLRNVLCDQGILDIPGYQFLQTRGLVIIDNPTLGKVAVLPVGMAMASSVRLTVKEGDKIEKGDEISYFQFGGSDIICVFERKAGLTEKDFVPSPTIPEKTYSKVGTILARAPLRD